MKCSMKKTVFVFLAVCLAGHSFIPSGAMASDTATGQFSDLVSQDGQYELVMQPDGNLVEYSGVHTPGNAVWSTGTYGIGTGPYNVFMQSDGNLVIYQKNAGVGDAANAIWGSSTWNQGTAPYKLQVLNNGNIEIIDNTNTVTWSSGSAQGSPVGGSANRGYANNPHISMVSSTTGAFSQLTSANGLFIVTMQSDGNLVTNRGTEFAWNSGTSGRGAAPFTSVMQSDGNLVIYQNGATSGPNEATWGSGTWGQGTGPYSLILENDGDLMMVDATGTLLWSGLNDELDHPIANPLAPNGVTASITGPAFVVHQTPNDTNGFHPDGHCPALQESDGTYTFYINPGSRVVGPDSNPNDTTDTVPRNFAPSTPGIAAFWANFQFTIGPDTQEIPPPAETGLRDDGKEYDENGAWANSIFRLANTSQPDANPNELIAFLHFEDHYPDQDNPPNANINCWWSTGVAYSHDDGLTWERGVPVVTSAFTQPPTEAPADSPDIYGGSAGAGNHVVVWDKTNQRWVMFFSDLNTGLPGQTGEPGWGCLSEAVSYDPLGGPGTWTKIDPIRHTSSPGFRGVHNPLSALMTAPGALPALSYNNADGRWIIVWDGPGGLDYAISTDLVNWTAPSVLNVLSTVTTSTGFSTHPYAPTIIGIDDTQANGQAKLYYGDLSNGGRIFTGENISW